MADIKSIQVDGIDYAIKDESARSNIGDLSQLATEAKGDLVSALNELSANAGSGSSPIQRVESLDESNLKNLRDLTTGSYVLYGYFRPYAGASNYLPFDNLLVNVYHVDEGSHLFEFSTANSEVNFIEILVDASAEGGHTYSRTAISMLELNGLIGKLGNLNELATTEKGSVVAAINEVAASGGSGSGSSVQADMAQNDSTQPDYVKNRTHWSEMATVVEEQSITTADMGGMAAYQFPEIIPLVVGSPVVTYYNSTEYECVAKEGYVDGLSVVYVGDLGLASGSHTDGEPPFLLLTAELVGMSMFATPSVETCTVKVVGENIVKIPDKYIPTLGMNMMPENVKAIDWENDQTSYGEAPFIFNKPFERTLVASNEWNGDLADKETVYVASYTTGSGTYSVYLCKISDDMPSGMNNYSTNAVYGVDWRKSGGVAVSSVENAHFDLLFGEDDAYFWVQRNISSAGFIDYSINVVVAPNGGVTPWGVTLTQGTYVAYETDSEGAVSKYLSELHIYEYHTLPSIYLEAVPRLTKPYADCLYLKSTTEGSDKCFKITVDDEGTLSAVEEYPWRKQSFGLA